MRPEFGLTEFKNVNGSACTCTAAEKADSEVTSHKHAQATILSNESKDKQLDTFKACVSCSLARESNPLEAHFTNTAGVKTEDSRREGWGGQASQVPFTVGRWT